MKAMSAKNKTLQTTTITIVAVAVLKHAPHCDYVPQ